MGIDRLPMRDEIWSHVVDGETENENPTLQLRSRKPEGRNSSSLVENVWIEAGLYHGGVMLQDLSREVACSRCTTEQPRSVNPRWHQWLDFEIPTAKFPSVRHPLRLARVSLALRLGRSATVC